MKKVRDKIEHFILCTDRKWKELPMKQQKLFTELFFVCYAIITAIVIINIRISTGNKSNVMSIDHITGISNLDNVKRVTNDKQIISQRKKQTDEKSR